MNEPIWVLEQIVIAVHEILLAEHGGLAGVRDKGLLESALAKPKQLFSYTVFKVVLVYLASFIKAKSSLHFEAC